MGLLRRAAPWCLLLFALFQVKTLTEKVKSIENDEFRAVQGEVRQLRDELHAFRADAEKTHQALDESREWLRTTSEFLDRARHRAPEVARRLAETEGMASSLQKAIPSDQVASRLGDGLQAASQSVSALRSAIPPAATAGALASSLAASSATLDQIRSTLPEPPRANALSASLGNLAKHLDSLNAALPRTAEASELSKGIAEEASRLKAVEEALPSPREVVALRDELERVKEEVARLGTQAKSTPPAVVLAKPPPGREGPGSQDALKARPLWA